jgi:hypothetical protein
MLYVHPRSRAAAAPKVLVRGPSAPGLTDGSKQLRKGHPSGGYTMAVEATAFREGLINRQSISPKPKGKKPAKLSGGKGKRTR